MSLTTLSQTVAAEAVNAAAQVPEDALEKLLYGLKVSFIGLSTVFLVLILIMLVLYVFRLVFYTIPNRKKEEAAAPAQPAAPAPAVETAVSVAEDDGEIAAAIAAAISVYMEENHPGTKYRIRSFKRI